MIARMGEVKLGKLISEDGEDISNVETVLKQYGVTLRDTSGQFKDMESVILSLSKRWKTLETTEKSEIAGQIAGLRNREKFLVLMENFDDALKLQEVSLNSSGSAMEKFAIYQESIAAKTAEFTNAFQGLAAATVDSGLVAWIVELGTGFLNLITSMGGLGPILTTVIALLVSLKSTKITEFFIGIGTSLKQSAAGLVSYISNITAATTATEGAKVAITGLGAAFNSALGAVGAVIAIFTIIKSVISAVGTENERAAKKVESASQAYDETKTKLEQVSAELKTASTRMDELSAKGTLTFVEQEELQKLKDITAELLLQEDILKRQEKVKLSELAKSIAESYETQFDGLTFSVDEVNKYIEESQIRSNTTMLTANDKNINALIAGYVRFTELKNKAISDYEEAKKIGADTSVYEEDMIYFSGLVSGVEDQIFGNVPKIQEFIKTIESIPEEKRIEILGMDWEKDLQNAQNGIELIYSYLAPEKWKEIQFSEILNLQEFENEVKTLRELADAGKFTAEVLSDPKYSKFIDKMKEMGFTVEDVVTEFSNFQNKVQEDVLSEFSRPYEELNKILSKSSKEFDVLSKVIEENNRNGKVSADTYKELTDINANYKDILTETIGGYNLNESAAEGHLQKLGTLRNILLGTKAAYLDFQNALKTPTKSSESYDVLSSALDTLRKGLKSGLTETDEFHEGLQLLFGDTPPTNMKKSLNFTEKLLSANEKGADAMYKALRKYTKDGHLDLQELQADWGYSDAFMQGLIDRFEELGLMTPTKASFDTIGNGLGLVSKKAVELESDVKKLYKNMHDGTITTAEEQDKAWAKISKKYGLSKDQMERVKRDFKFLNEGLTQDTITAFSGLEGPIEDAVKESLDNFNQKDLSGDFLSGFSAGELKLEDFLDTSDLETEIRNTLKATGLFADAEIERMVSQLTGRAVQLKIQGAIETSLTGLGLDENLSAEISTALMTAYDPETKTFDIPVAVKAAVSEVEVEGYSQEDLQSMIDSALVDSTDENGEVDLNKLSVNIANLGIDELSTTLPTIVTALGNVNSQSMELITAQTQSLESQLATALTELQSMVDSMTTLDASKLSTVTGQVDGLSSSLSTTLGTAQSLIEAMGILATGSPKPTGTGSSSGGGAQPEPKVATTDVQVSTDQRPVIDGVLNIVHFVADPNAVVDPPPTGTDAEIVNYKEGEGATVENPSVKAEAFLINYTGGPDVPVDPPSAGVPADIDHYKEGAGATVDDPTDKVTVESDHYTEADGATVDNPTAKAKAETDHYSEADGATLENPSEKAKAETDHYAEADGATVDNPTDKVTVESDSYLEAPGATVENPTALADVGVGNYSETESAAGSKDELLGDLTGDITTYDDSGAEKPTLEIIAKVVYEGTPESLGAASDELTEPQGAFGIGQDHLARINDLIDAARRYKEAMDEAGASAETTSSLVADIEALESFGTAADAATFVGEFNAAVEKGEKPTEEQIAQMKTLVTLFDSLQKAMDDSMLLGPLMESLSGALGEDWSGSTDTAVASIQTLVDKAAELQGLADAATEAKDGISGIGDASLSGVTGEAEGLSGALDGVSDSAGDAESSVSGVNDESMSSVKGQLAGVGRAAVLAGQEADSLKTKLNDLDGTQVNVSINVSGGQVPAAATGKKYAQKGIHLVDDGVGAYKGPELIIHRKTGTYEIGSGESPRLTHLDTGDTVLNAIQTRQALNKSAIASGDSFATGSYLAKALITIPSGGSGSGSGSSSSGSGKKKKSKKLSDAEIQKLFDDLRHRFAMEEITEEYFYERLEELNNKYYKDKKKKLQEYWKIQEEIYAWEKAVQIERLDSQIDYNEAIRDAYSEDHEEYIKHTEELFRLQSEKQDILAEKLKHYRDLGFSEDSEILMDLKSQWLDIEKWKREEIIKTKELELSRMETATSAVIGVIDDEIEKLNEQKKTLQELNKEQEKKITLQELEDNLARARRNRTIRIYRENVGFVYELDSKAIEESEKALRDFQLEEQIEAIDKSIDAWEKYKKQWQSVATDYAKEQDRLLAAQVLGADFEEQILNQRLDILENFKSNYIRIQQELLAAQNAVVNLGPTSSGSSGSSHSGIEVIVPVRDNEVTEVDWDTGLPVPVEIKVDVKDDEVFEVPWQDIQELLKKQGYASGTKHATKGIHKVDELGAELLIGPNKGRYTYLEAGSQVMTANLAQNLFSVAQNPIKWIKDALSSFPQTKGSHNVPGYTISIGDINILNPVGNGDDLARELNASLPSIGLQIVMGTN